MWQVELVEGNRGIVVLWVEPPKTFLKTAPFALAINVTSALFSYQNLFGKACTVTSPHNIS